MLKDIIKSKSETELFVLIISAIVSTVSLLIVIVSFFGTQTQTNALIRGESVLIAIQSVIIFSVVLSFKKPRLKCLIAAWLSVAGCYVIRQSYNPFEFWKFYSSIMEITWTTVAILIILFVLIIVTIHKEKKAKKAEAVQLNQTVEENR